MRSSLLFVAAVVVAVGGCPAPEGVTYHKDIAPLFERECVSCHSAGGIAPFTLASYDDVKQNGAAIAFSVENRIMPPFTLDNTGACGPTFKDARFLTDDEIALVLGWLNDDAPEGNAVADANAAGAVEEGLDDENAVVVEMAEPYTPTPQPGFPNDDYRCFFLDAENEADAYLTGYEIFPGQPDQVHHMLLFALLNEEADALAQELDDTQEGPGWSCFGAAGDGIDSDDYLMLTAWAPGANVVRYPEGTGVYVPAGRRLVMQIHYNLSAGAAPDQTALAVALAPSVENDALMLPLADDDWEIPANTPEFSYKFTQSLLGLPEPLSIHGIFPHMHTAGRKLRFEMKNIGQADSTQCLGDIQRWDFHWQQVAFYDEPVVVDGGHQLDVTCTWDTTGRDVPTVWGEGTGDEMCLVFVYVTKTSPGSVIQLIEDL